VVCAVLAALALFSGSPVSDHDVTVQLYYDGGWHDAPALTRGGVTLSRGAAGEGQDAPPSAAGLQLDNRTGAYNPRNPAGPLYGLVGRNTPMRVSADGSVRSTTEVSSWAPGREIKGSAWTTVQGGGLMRRLQQGTTPLRTPAVRAVPSASNLIAFWPLEEGEDATYAASGLDGGDPLTLSGAIGFGRGAGLPGWPPIVDLGQGGGTLTAPIRGAGSTAFGIEYVVRYPTRDSGLAVSPTLMDIRFSGGSIARLTLFADPYMYALPVDAADLGLGAAARPEVPVYDSVYRHFQLDVDQDGSDVILTWYINGEFISTGSFPGQETYTGQTMGTPYQVQINPAGNSVGMPALGYLGFYSSASPGWSGAGIPHLGYPGELAGQRFLRVADEEGVDADVIGDPDDTQAMGPQPAASLVDVLRECVRTDDGMLFEARDDRTLIMRTGRDRYNQASSLTLDFTGEQLAPGLAPVIDDAPTRNDVTAARRGGGSARAVQLTGPLNVQDPIADPQGIGRVDHRVDVNTATDAVLLSHASWHLAKGTVDEPRYPNITVDLDARGVEPALIAALDALEIGDRFEVENLPADWQAGNASLLLLGVRENYPAGAGDYRRLVTLNAAPASVYEIGIVGADNGSTDLRGQAVDTDLSTLSSGVGAYATSLSVTTSSVVWTTDSDDWNPALNGGGLFVEIGGEQMRVTSITGASSPQTVAVVRSTNGVVKAHAAGAAVDAAHPIRVGL
jgi:hypothetical protein